MKRITGTHLGIAVVLLFFFVQVTFAEVRPGSPDIQPEIPEPPVIIPGEVEGDTTQDGSLNTVNQNSTVNSNNTSANNSKTYNGAGSSGMPASSAMSPSYISTGSESCLQGISGAAQGQVFGISTGIYREDEKCNRRRDAKVLNDLGMKVAAVARMCQQEEVWKAMFISGTPCPLIRSGKLVVGKRAYLIMKQNPATYIPKYEEQEEWYNTILGIGETSEEDSTNGGTNLSISERFRSSRRD